MSFGEQFFKPVAPGLLNYPDDILYHQVWLRPGLAPRTRNLATISALNGRFVINGGCRIPDPAYSRHFQLRSEEGTGYKERVQ